MELCQLIEVVHIHNADSLGRLVLAECLKGTRDQRVTNHKKWLSDLSSCKDVGVELLCDPGNELASGAFSRKDDLSWLGILWVETEEGVHEVDKLRGDLFHAREHIIRVLPIREASAHRLVQVENVRHL